MTTAEMLQLLNNACPAWRTRYGNGNMAVAAFSPLLDEPYAQWLGTEAGQKLTANREKWEARYRQQLAEKGRALRTERKLEREEGGPAGLKLFTLGTLGAAIQYSVTEGLTEK